MDKFRLDGPADAETELEQLLEFNGIAAVRDGKDFRFILSSKGVKWETVCSPTADGAAMLYGIYPFTVADREYAMQLCTRVNRSARYGAMFLEEDRLVFRIGADLFDVYSAYETLGRALEYSAGIMTRFWVQASAVSKERSPV